jgi:hypothetical protein
MRVWADASGLTDAECSRFKKVFVASDSESRRECQTMLAEHPELGESVANVARIAEASIVSAWIGDRAESGSLAEAIQIKCDALRRDLGYDASSALERMLIDRLVACWLHVNYAEHCRSRQWQDGSSFTAVGFYDEAVSRANADFLRAAQSLARVRKLLQPTVAQINIAAAGGQQVNQVNS